MIFHLITILLGNLKLVNNKYINIDLKEVSLNKMYMIFQLITVLLRNLTNI